MRYVEVYNDDDEQVRVPAAWEICFRCSGEGGTSDHLGVFYEGDPWMADDDFREDYFAGRFDRPCEDCKGSGKVLTVDRLRASDDEQRWYDRGVQEIADMHAEMEAERRAGC